MPTTLGPKAATSSTSAPAPAPTDWEKNFLNYGMSPQAAKTAAGYIERGMDPAVALHTVYSFGLDKAPASDWEDFQRNSPIQANTKKLLVTGARGLQNIAAPLGGSIPNPVHEKEKMSAAKMLKDYLMHQDMQRAGDVQKDAMWQQIHNAQVQDQFFTDNMRPPTSLGDFALAGMNYRPSTPVEGDMPQRMPTRLPGEIAKNAL